MTHRYVHRERVRFGDLDANAHLNNVVYLRYFETARIAYMREMVPALDPGRRERPQSGLIFAECHIRYRSPVRFDEEVTITCWIGEVRRSAFQMCFEMKVEERWWPRDMAGWSASTTRSRRQRAYLTRCGPSLRTPPRPTPVAAAPPSD